MSKEWFCLIGGMQFGPFTAEDLWKLAAEGKLRPDNDIKHGVGGAWIKAENLTDLFGNPVSPSPVSQPSVPLTKSPDAAYDQGDAADSSLTPEWMASDRDKDEDPLEAIAESEAVAPHLGKRGWGKHHGKKTDNSALFVMVPVGIAVLIGAVIFMSMMAKRDAGPPVERLDEMLKRRAQEPKPADLDPAFAPSDNKAGPAKVAESATPQKQAEPRPEDGKWHDASKGAWCGDATVKVLSAEIAAPKVVTAGGQEIRGKELMLLLKLEVRNNRDDRALEYTSWSVGGPTMSTVKLSDNRSRPCAVKFKAAFAGFMLDRQLTKATIDAKGSIEDVLAFQQPGIDEKWKYLRLQLPASAFGEKGYVRLEIPASMVVVKESVSNPAPQPRSNPKADFGIDGGLEAPADRPPPLSNADSPQADADQGGDVIGGIGELQRDESDLVRKKAEREASEKAAAEAAKNKPKKPPANPAEALFKRF